MTTIARIGRVELQDAGWVALGAQDANIGRLESPGSEKRLCHELVVVDIIRHSPEGWRLRLHLCS